MKLEFVESMKIVLVQGPYSEKQAYDARGITYPPKAAGLGWHKDTKAWIGRATEDSLNTLMELIEAAKALGLPGLDEEEPSQ